MQKRFNSLRIISALIKFSAIIIALASVIGFLFSLYVALARPAEFYPTNVSNAYAFVLGGGAGGLFGGLFVALLIYGTGAMIDLNLSIEEHTRATAIYSRRLLAAYREQRPAANTPNASQPRRPQAAPPPQPAAQPRPADPIRPLAPPAPAPAALRNAPPAAPAPKPADEPMPVPGASRRRATQTAAAIPETPPTPIPRADLYAMKPEDDFTDEESFG